MTTSETNEAARPRNPARELNASELIVILSRIYADAGLPADAAYRSAVADYECTFEEPMAQSA